MNRSRHSRWAICLRLIASIFLCWWACLASGQSANTGATAGTEALVIVVNKANPVENLTSEELRKYFRLEQARWPDGRKNTVLMLPSGTVERETVFQKIYQFSESEFTRHFLQANFTGQAQSTPKNLISAGNVLKFVFNVPGAIGYVRASQVDDTVKVVRINGRLPGDTDYHLKLLPK